MVILYVILAILFMSQYFAFSELTIVYCRFVAQQGRGFDQFSEIHEPNLLVIAKCPFFKEIFRRLFIAYWFLKLEVILRG
jgi:hypothetical protein